MADYLFENMAPPRMPRKFVTPPKRRDDDSDETMEDHELFLTAFEKPTQIYRYLETRHSELPLFLHRNLSYMMGYRVSRKRNTRDIGLNYIVKKLKEFHRKSTAMMNLKFVGFFEENWNNISNSVEIETFLVKKSPLKETTRISVGKYKVPVNQIKSAKENNEVSIYLDDFKKDENICSCALQFIAKVPRAKSKTRSGRPALISKKIVELNNEILIWTKQNFHLTDGLYDVAFEENDDKENRGNENNCKWKSFKSEVKKELKFSSCLRFQLTLSGLNIKRSNTRLKKNDFVPLEKPIIFQFLYGNFSQKTNASYVPNCPWCTVDCGSMYSLLKHLRVCHDRMCFKYAKTSKEHRIKVIVNEFFDGSYEAGPYEYSFSQSCLIPGPKRKYPCTKILVYRSKKPQPNLSEFSKFIEYEEKPLIEGHHRLYYHSATGVPKYPQELSDDSEDETDPLWLQDSVTRMVDAFRDVNDGEKEIMKMWNHHTLKHGYLGNCHMEIACTTFIEERGNDILSKNLYRNFILHLSNMVDFEAITSKIMFSVVKKLQEKFENCDRNILSRIFHPSPRQCKEKFMEKINGQIKRKKSFSSPATEKKLRRRIPL